MYKRLVLAFVLLSVLITACTNQDAARDQAYQNAANREYYVPHNDVEGRNYNWRLQLSDDPSLILWCTFFPPTPGSKPVTIPVIGKLTSSGKRPFYSEYGIDSQGMYGSSADYRFGFGPTGMYEYYDFFDIPSFCTTQPMTWQSELTIVVQSKDEGLLAASTRAGELIRAGDYAGAQAVLDAAIVESSK